MLEQTRTLADELTQLETLCFIISDLSGICERKAPAYSDVHYPLNQEIDYLNKLEEFQTKIENIRRDIKKLEEERDQLVDCNNKYDEISKKMTNKSYRINFHNKEWKKIRKYLNRAPNRCDNIVSEIEDVKGIITVIKARSKYQTVCFFYDKETSLSLQTLKLERDTLQKRIKFSLEDRSLPEELSHFQSLLAPFTDYPLPC
jgi:chromosome segregation ATPase